MINLKLVNIDPENYILAVRAAKSFIKEEKPIGVRHGSMYSYTVDGVWKVGVPTFYCYRTKTMVIVRKS